MQPNNSSIVHPFPSDTSEVPNQADHLGTHATLNTQAMQCYSHLPSRVDRASALVDLAVNDRRQMKIQYNLFYKIY